jgi:SpoIID/LytB domain protein
MCQWGAKGMAEQGYSARQILEFFYPGTSPGSLDTRAAK